MTALFPCCPPRHSFAASLPPSLFSQAVHRRWGVEVSTEQFFAAAPSCLGFPSALLWSVHGPQIFRNIHLLLHGLTMGSSVDIYFTTEQLLLLWALWSLCCFSPFWFSPPLLCFRCVSPETPYTWLMCSAVSHGGFIVKMARTSCLQQSFDT